MAFMTSLLNKIPLSRWPLLLAGGSLSLLLGAWGFQYIGLFEPCALCFDQRDIHKVVILLGALLGGLLLLKPSLERFAPWLILPVSAVLVYSAWFAGWHAGIEWDFWDGPETCTAGGVLLATGNPLDALEAGLRPAMCDEANWRLLGISMAGYNALISAAMAGMSIFVAVTAIKK
jgi:disulfide bond formation protein DsbB